MTRALVFAAFLTLAACGQPAAPAKTETTAPAAAESAPPFTVESLFPGGACYLATYDEPHLAAHPQQTIVTFLITDVGEDVRALDTETQKHLGFAFQIKDDSDIYTGLGACTPSQSAAACLIEGDGGEFTITPTTNGLRVDIARMEIEGPERVTPDLAHSAENRTLQLTRSSGTDCLTD